MPRSPDGSACRCARSTASWSGHGTICAAISEANSRDEALRSPQRMKTGEGAKRCLPLRLDHDDFGLIHAKIKRDPVHEFNAGCGRKTVSRFSPSRSRSRGLILLPALGCCGEADRFLGGAEQGLRLVDAF